MGISRSFCDYLAWWNSSLLTKHWKHIGQVWLVLTKLWEHDLYAKREKCEFNCTSIELLGYAISYQENTMEFMEGQDYSRWATMTQLKDSQSFLGFANFYQWFIKGFLRFVQPLIALMCKDSPFKLCFSMWCLLFYSIDPFFLSALFLEVITYICSQCITLRLNILKLMHVIADSKIPGGKEKLGLTKSHIM